MRLGVLAIIAFPALAHAGDPRTDQPRLLGFGKDGISAGDKLLFTGKVDAAAYDPAQDLIWFVTGRQLEVLDLRDANAQPVVIASHWPKYGFGIDGWSHAELDTFFTGAYPELDLDDKPTIVIAGGAEYDNWDAIDPHAKRNIKRAKLIGQDWLAAQADRKSRELPAVDDSELPKVTLPDGTCDDNRDTDCGAVQPLGRTRYQLVQVEMDCGDACYTSCLLYDPKSGLLADPGKTSSWSATDYGSDTDTVGCGDSGEDVLRADGDHPAYYIHDPSRADTRASSKGDQVCTVGKKGVRCRVAKGWRFFGWLSE